MRFLNLIANHFFALLFTYLLNQRFTDTLCGTKVLLRARLRARSPRNRAYFGDFDPFGDFDLIFGAAKLNLKIVEVPIRYAAREYGETQISRFRHGWLLLRMVVFAFRKLKASVTIVHRERICTIPCRMRCCGPIASSSPADSCASMGAQRCSLPCTMSTRLVRSRTDRTAPGLSAAGAARDRRRRQHRFLHAAICPLGRPHPASVIAIEPEAVNFAELTRRIAGSGLSACRLHPAGRGRPHRRARSRLVVNRIIPAIISSATTACRCSAVTIDELVASEIGTPALIKIDVQGAERACLPAPRRVLERDRPALFVEIDPAALSNFGTHRRRGCLHLLARFDYGPHTLETQRPTGRWHSPTLRRTARSRLCRLFFSLLGPPQSLTPPTPSMIRCTIARCGTQARAAPGLRRHLPADAGRARRGPSSKSAAARATSRRFAPQTTSDISCRAVARRGLRRAAPAVLDRLIRQCRDGRRAASRRTPGSAR